jgi:hypothetical protein
MRKSKRRPPSPPRSSGDGVLDSFTEAQLDAWTRGGDLLQRLADKAYFELEALRAGKYDAPCDALRSSPGVSLDVNGWSRVTDYRWSLSPLSPAGSIKGIGGRFNIGETLDRARGQSFPCLYIAQSVETAYAEYFCESPSIQMGPLTLGEFALRHESSFTTIKWTTRACAGSKRGHGSETVCRYHSALQLFFGDQISLSQRWTTATRDHKVCQALAPPSTHVS